MTSIFWLGAHKTATTFLQKSLDRSQDALHDHGVAYVELDEFRDKYTRPLLNARPDQEPAPNEFTDEARVNLVFDENIPGLVQHALSRDGFYPEMLSRVDTIAGHLELPIDEMVFGVRNYDAYLPSLYSETLKSTPFETFDAYLAKSFDGSDGFGRLDWHALLRRFVDAHPGTRVRVYFHEDLRGHEAALLSRVLGVPSGAFDLVTSSERVGFSGRAIEELHAIHDTRPVGRVDVRNAVKDYPTSKDQPSFFPWDDEQREILRTAYQRHRAQIMADGDLEVIDLGGRPVARARRRDAGQGSADGHRTDQPDLSVVIPVHDAADTLADTASSFLDLDDLEVQLVLVDDHSGDGSGDIIDELAQRPDVVAFHHGSNQGAGVARNTGFRAAIGRYTLFFDADDVLHPAALQAVIPAMDVAHADVAVLPYRYRRGGEPDRQEMNTYDLAFWQEEVGAALQRLGTLDDMPRVVGVSNYPWNKVLRTETYRGAGLRFGSTPVHNDILGHWYSLLFADQVLLFNQEICTHVVESGASNLTNRHSRDRLALFDALDETYDLLEDNPALRNRYAHHYWSSTMRVADWAGSRIAPEARDEFRLRLQRHLLRARLADFSRIRMKRDPALADAILRKALS